MARVLLALGSNLGDRREMLSRVTSVVASLPETQLLARSSWHETTPIGGQSGQGAYLNGSLLLETRFSPQELSDAIHEIERRLGRQREVRWDSRLIDIDLLLYDLETVGSKELTIPHPRMSFRRFVLEPACEVAGFMVHPSSGWTLARLLYHLRRAPHYVAVTAAEPAAAQRLAKGLCEELGGLQLEARFPGLISSPDPITPQGVQFVLDKADALSREKWQHDEQLSARLSVSAGISPPPVVSSFWPEAPELRQVSPALVVAWEQSVGTELETELKNKLDRPGHGPLARIESDDYDAVLAEALAAIRAVWPNL